MSASGLAAIGALAGCDRTHMDSNYGVAERLAFQSQVISPDAGSEAKPEQPLDPEEAAVVARTYRRSLAPASQQGAAVGGQMLVVPTGAGVGMAAAGAAP